MSERVPSTEKAKAAIPDIETIINGRLAEQFGGLDSNGQKLSRPDVWDGPLATTFRSRTWPEIKTGLQKAKTELSTGDRVAVSGVLGGAGGAYSRATR